MSKNLLQQRQRHQQCIRASTGGASLFTKHYVNAFINKRPRSLCQRRMEDIQKELNAPFYTCTGLHTPTYHNLAHKQKRTKCPNDYQIYQNASLATFFGTGCNKKSYANVSDVCLLNDHNIFVKMPFKFNVLSATTVQQTSLDQQGQRPISEINGKGGNSVSSAYSKLPRCFKCNRSKRVSPIIEELEDHLQHQYAQQWKQYPESSNHGQNLVQSTPDQLRWRTSNDDIEIFESRTRITRVAAKKQKPTAPSSLANKHAFNVAHTQPNAVHDAVQPELHTKLAALPTQYASAQTPMLLTQQTTPFTLKSTSTNNNNDIHVGGVVGSNNSNNNNNSSRGLTLASMHHWLLRTFSRKSSVDDSDHEVVVKKKKEKPIRIRAAVHKTYFVRWVKPPETHWHGYGVRRPHCQDGSLRRCRSAVY